MRLIWCWGAFFGECSFSKVVDFDASCCFKLFLGIFKQLAVLYSDFWPKARGKHGNSPKEDERQKENESFTSTGRLKLMSQ